MRFVFLAITVFLLVGCKPAVQRELEVRMRSASKQRLSFEDIINICGKPAHIYTQEEVRGYLKNTPEEDVSVYQTWLLFSHYPRVAYYPGPKTFQNYIFLDEEGRAAGCYFEAQ